VTEFGYTAQPGREGSHVICSHVWKALTMSSPGSCNCWHRKVPRAVYRRGTDLELSTWPSRIELNAYLLYPML